MAAASSAEVQFIDSRPMGTAWVADRLWERLGIAKVMTAAADLLRVAETMPPRDHALICLLGLNGLQVSESCALQIR